MTPTQAVLVCKRIKAATSQWMDEYAPDVWYDMALKDMDYLDAKDVADSLCVQLQKVSLADLCEGVKEVREYRLLITPDVVPDADPDDPQAYIDELRRQRERRMARPDQPKELA